MEVAILSGDRPVAVAAIAEKLAVKTWFGGVKPAEKASLLTRGQKEGRKIVMVGDGINDAPAQACAHASLSPVTAAQLAQASSDAVFLSDRLHAVVDALRISRQGRSLMRQNLLLSVAYNVIALPLAIAGWMTPLLAAAAMSGSSLLVTANALRAVRSGTCLPASQPPGSEPLVGVAE
jgi:Cu2+-exporting ATPase